MGHLRQKVLDQPFIKDTHTHRHARTHTHIHKNTQAQVFFLFYTYLIMRVSFIRQIFFGYLLYEKHSSRHKGHSNEKRQKVLPPRTLHSSRNVPFKFPFGKGLHYITKRGWFKKSPEEIIEIPGRCSERGLGYPQKAEKKFPFRGNKYKLDLRKHTVWTGREAGGGGGRAVRWAQARKPSWRDHSQEGRWESPCRWQAGALCQGTKPFRNVVNLVTEQTDWSTRIQHVLFAEWLQV